MHSSSEDVGLVDQAHLEEEDVLTFPSWAHRALTPQHMLHLEGPSKAERDLRDYDQRHIMDSVFAKHPGQ